MVFFSIFPYLLFLSTLLLPIQSNSILCAGDLYGKPLLSDALTLAHALPYVKSDPDHQMDAGRTFAEPAFFTPKFQGLLNIWDTSMVQLPLVWRFRSARIALLFYANAAGQVVTPSVNANWRIVQFATAGITQSCIRGQRGVGGVRVMSDPAGNPFLSLYLYASGSPFEAVVNKYMVTGLGVNPFNPRGLGAEGVVRNATLLGGELGAALGGMGKGGLG
ncbi:hypothetical protein BDR22DRAFT_887623 [Usnea florida]